MPISSPQRLSFMVEGGVRRPLSFFSRSSGAREGAGRARIGKRSALPSSPIWSASRPLSFGRRHPQGAQAGPQGVWVTAGVTGTLVGEPPFGAEDGDVALGARRGV